jgi:tetratricopeptide (TPR) repeat protein
MADTRTHKEPLTTFSSKFLFLTNKKKPKFKMATIQSPQTDSSASSPKHERPRKRIKSSSDADTVPLLIQMGISKFDQGDHSEAEKFFSEALYRHEIDFPTFRLPLSMDKFIATTDKTSGNLLTLEENKESAKRSTDRPSSLPLPLTSRRRRRRRQRYEYNEGMHVYDNPLPIRRTSNQEHTSATLLYNIALTHVRRGQYNSAVVLFEQALARASCPTGTPVADSEFATMVSHNLGHCFYRLGNKERSLQHYQQALSVASTLGLSSSHLAVALNCVGVLYCYHHQVDEAIKMFERSLELFRTQSGPDSSEAATILNNVGSAYYLCASFEKALSAYKASLKLRKVVLGKDSIEVAATIFNIGLTCHRIGQWDESMQCYREFLDIAEGYLGIESRDVTIAYMRMAEIHNERRELDLAVSVYKKALKCGRAAMGKWHPEVASILNRLGNLCCEIHDLDDAMRYYRKGLKTERAIWGPNHPHIIITVTNIAHIHKHREDFAEALRSFMLVRKLQAESLGRIHVDLAETHTSIGLMQYRMHDHEGSFNSYQEALRIRREHYETEDHLDVASALNSVGLAAFKFGLFEVAKSCITQSLNILKKVAGEDSRDVAVLWYNIATIYFETGESEDIAIKYYKETLRIERHSLGDDHPDVVLTLLHMGQKHYKVGDLEDALEYFAEALAIERGRTQENKVTIGKILNLIGNVHLQRGAIAKMMECYVEASRLLEAAQESGETLAIAGYDFYGLSKMHPCCPAVA